MEHLIVTYNGSAWNRLTLPKRGGAMLYSDGLLNVLDAKGRVMDTKHDVTRIEIADLTDEQVANLPRLGKPTP